MNIAMNLASFHNPSFLWRFLTALFSIGALLFLLVSYFSTRRTIRRYIASDPPSEESDRFITKARNRFGLSFLGVMILAYSFISSFHVLTSPITDIKNAWFLVNSSVAFLIVIFIKVLLCSWIIALIAGLMKPDRLSEFAAKFFGFEITQKYAPEQIREIDRTLNDMQARINRLTTLTRETMDYIASAFEGVILNDENPVEKIREVVRYTLQSAYYSFDSVKIYVLPLTGEGIESLPVHLHPLVKKRMDENVDLSIVEKKTVGIGIHYGNGDLSTLIVMDGTNGQYEITLPEIYIASNFFITISTIATWASRAPETTEACQ